MGLYATKQSVIIGLQRRKRLDVAVENLDATQLSI